MTTTVPGATVSITQLHKDIGMIREAVQASREIPLTYHHQPIAVVVPHHRRERDRAELARLRSEVNTLRTLLGKTPTAPPD